MAQKKSEGNKDIEYIKDMLESEKLIIGADRAVKSLKDGNVAKIFLAKNAPEKLVEDVNYYAGLSGAEVIQLEISNEDLGVVCKRPFLIAVVSILK
ncbi:ribosomal L7Ae/L30e/S12e/Gadd45 family protein [Candidatus Woesearchaeota archaeon]|nr:ribosomal L7Ae/L30e/S12e/Gadd45 family protein [Candidatus Woesearchaeota archaeon]